jgi:hypothetical protein
LRKTFLKEHRPATYTAFLITGRLSEHLAETDCLARERVQLLTEGLAKALGVTETMKAVDSMMWTGLMNNIKASAEEVVLSKVIFA